MWRLTIDVRTAMAPAPGKRGFAMRVLLWITLAMPAVIFLLAARALVVRLRLESRGFAARATVTSYSYWVDDMSHHDVTYRFVVGDREYTGSGSADRKYEIGDVVDVMYHADRPDFNQLVSGGVVTSAGLNVFVMLGMVATEIWLLSLMPA
jgi:hypothetical protein